MNTTSEISPAEREFGVRIRGLLLMAVDLIERRYHLGKHSQGKEAGRSGTETIASAVTTETGSDAKRDTLSAV